MIIRKINKKGDGGWTVPKLVSLILLVIVIVLVFVGLTTGSLNPLVKKLKDTWNYVLSLFGKKEVPSSTVNTIQCIILGKERTVDINYYDGWCKVSLEADLGSYGIFGGKFSYYDDVIVISQPAVPEGNVGNLYFRFSKILGLWQWSPNKINWMNVPDIVARTNDKYNEKTPVQANVDIIKALAGKDLAGGQSAIWTTKHEKLWTVSKDFTSIEGDIDAIGKPSSPTLQIWKPVLGADSQSNYVFYGGTWGSTSDVYLSTDEQTDFKKGFDRIIDNSFSEATKIKVLGKDSEVLYAKDVTDAVRASVEEKNTIKNEARVIMNNIKEPPNFVLTKVKQDLAICCQGI